MLCLCRPQARVPAVGFCIGGVSDVSSQFYIGTNLKKQKDDTRKRVTTTTRPEKTKNAPKHGNRIYRHEQSYDTMSGTMNRAYE